ncbi:tetratricopeptide repeat protein [Planctomycetota bacterium]|nr:tetratricopeptide repeat protein [Planctomycetota bacterium]
MQAEDFYVFRHSLMRDAAYELQPPSSRAASHFLAIESCLSVFQNDIPPVLAAEMTEHAARAMESDQDLATAKVWRARFLKQAVSYAIEGYQLHEVIRHSSALAELDWLSLFDRVDALFGAAEYCDRTGQRERAEVFVKRGIVGLESAEPNTETKKKWSRGMILRAVICTHQGDYPQAATVLEELTTQPDGEIPDRVRAVALGNLAIVHREIGEIELAEEGYRAAIALSKQAGDSASVGRNTGNLANLLQVQARYDEAAEAFSEAIRLARDAKDPMTEGIVTGNFAELLVLRGEYDEARKRISHSHAIQDRLGDLEGESQGKSTLARIYAKQGEFTQAVEFAEAAVAGLDKAESPFLAASARCRLASYLLAVGDVARAKVVQQASESELSRMGAKEILWCGALPVRVEIALSDPPSVGELTTLLAEVEEALRGIADIGISPKTEGAEKLQKCREQLHEAVNVA